MPSLLLCINAIALGNVVLLKRLTKLDGKLLIVAIAIAVKASFEGAKPNYSNPPSEVWNLSKS